MEPLKQLNQAIRYIDAHLAAEIDFQQVARLAGCSEYHFRRMFSSLAGIPLNEYIRRRRLAAAALELQHSSIRVIDLALKYGYESPDAFSRAFQGLHGLSPTEARQPGAVVKAVPPMTFRLHIQGAKAMDYRIIDKEKFYIVGLMQRVTLVYEGVNPEIAAMWQRLTPEMIQALKALSNVEPQGMISASTHFSEDRAEGSQLDQYIGVASRSPAEGWQVLEVPAGSWVVFTVRGAFPQALQETWGRIYAEWLPSTSYEVREGPEMLWNESKDTSQPDYHSEIWIPVRQR